MQQNFVRRFTGRAAVYSTSRPGYPDKILDILRSEIGFDETQIVADIGSGTGLLSKLFLQNRNVVFGVEPNDEMRSFAQRNLTRFPKFVSVNGTAEHTTLGNASIDLVTVGQALHWFDAESAQREFGRILKTDGRVCVVYNDRNKNDVFMKNYDEVIRKYAKDRAKVPEVNDNYLSRFFKDGNYSRFLLSNEQLLDFEGLLGRMTSASYMPSTADKARFNALKQDADALFQSTEKLGRVRLVYDTVIFLGRIQNSPSLRAEYSRLEWIVSPKIRCMQRRDCRSRPGTFLSEWQRDN